MTISTAKPCNKTAFNEVRQTLILRLRCAKIEEIKVV
nr:MAG TPA: hypothetical protein [Caudoviricetes sp.]